MGDEQHPRFALLRFAGEIGTKARATRLQFRRRLVHNLKDALVTHGFPARLDVSHERIFVPLPEQDPGPTEGAGEFHHPLTRVFGIQSLSFVERRSITSLDDIVRAGEALFAERVRDRRFAVRVRNVGDRGPRAFRSPEVERALGTALLRTAAGVDLSHPEVTVHIETSSSGTSYFSERIPAPGGLPLGVEGEALALISGGIDSAVAAWQMLKRGVSLDYVFCNLGGDAHLHGTVRVAKVLADRWSYGDRPRLHAIDFEPITGALRANTERRYWQILLKRMMLRAASALSRERRTAAIITGEAVGQVSSQTLQNLAVISRATEENVLRPLVGFNKDEIIAAAERIGTFDLSKTVKEYCALVGHKPATRANLSAIEREEAKLDLTLVDRAVAARSVINLRELSMESLEIPELAIERIPRDAVVIDLRPIAQYRSGHYTDALHLDVGRAVQALASMDRARTYVLSCEFGLLSAHLAQQMRREGFDAYHFRGGQRALMEAAR